MPLLILLSALFTALTGAIGVRAPAAPVAVSAAASVAERVAQATVVRPAALVFATVTPHVAAWRSPAPLVSVARYADRRRE